jgi:hypothetical protein
MAKIISEILFSRLVINRNCKVIAFVLKIFLFLVFSVRSSDLAVRTRSSGSAGQILLAKSAVLEYAWTSPSKVCRPSFKTTKRILSLRGGRSARAKRPPPRAIGEDRLFDIAQNANDANDNHDRQCEQNISRVEPLPTSIDPEDDDKSTSALTQNETGLVIKARSSAKLEEDRQLRELRASVLQRVAALFPSGVNITALALGNTDPRSRSIFHRAILSMQEEDEEEDHCDVNSLVSGRAPLPPGFGQLARPHADNTRRIPFADSPLPPPARRRTRIGAAAG